jgi:hypothetical protein
MDRVEFGLYSEQNPPDSRRILGGKPGVSVRPPSLRDLDGRTFFIKTSRQSSFRAIWRTFFALSFCVISPRKKKRGLFNAKYGRSKRPKTGASRVDI